MRLSEVLLRLGTHLVAWLIIYTQCIWLAVIPRIGCSHEGVELYALSLGFAPFALGSALVLPVAGKLTGVVSYLKWLAIPLIVLLPLASIPVWQGLEQATLANAALCGTDEAGGWQRVWAPIQCIVLATIVWMSIRFIRQPAHT